MRSVENQDARATYFFVAQAVFVALADRGAVSASGGGWPLVEFSDGRVSVSRIR